MKSTIIRKDISKITAYKPGKPIQEVKRELGIKNVIKLASNENSLGPSPKALKAITKSLKELNRYPEGSCFYLKKKLAKILNVSSENLIFGNGSDELIDIILKTVSSKNAEILTSKDTFVEYKICGQISGFFVKEIPLKNLKYDLDAILKSISPKTKVIFIANPNNPTGTYVKTEEVKGFLKKVPKDILVVFDEAYIEFTDSSDFPKLINLIEKRPLALLRTFSKIYGLAGLRIGYMLASKSFISAAERVRQPFNTNLLAQAAAIAALDDKNFVKKSRNLVKKEGKFLYDSFSRLGIPYTESATNFILIRVGPTAKTLYSSLLKKGLIVRCMGEGLKEYIRITIGTRKENQKLINALATLKKTGDI